ncbi:MAG: HAMP domain-containing histidine kinase [Anaerolineales bacterium]|nr:HAMP domain-containing histidine kinase [Anaerolineales bacterium]
MSIQKLIAKIKPTLFNRLSHNLARGENVRESFNEELERFFDLLEQAIESGDPAWLDPVLNEWTQSPTLTELKEGQYNASIMLNKMIRSTIEVAREVLSKNAALGLLEAVVPILSYALEKVTRQEMDARVTYISNQLDEVRQKLEKLDRSKSNFIAVAAHELKTPLTLIEGYTSMLRDMAPNDETNDLDMLIMGVHTGIRRLSEILDDMIDVSLIDNNLLSLTLQPTWVNHLLGLLQSDAQEALAGRKQTLIINQFPGREQIIFADSERLFQALRNILINAIKFTPDGGTITIDGRQLPGFIEIMISDTGIGISAENQATIFEKFEQLGRADLHSSGKTKFKGGGPGLGLPISRGIIESHGGTLWVESDGCDEIELPGSTFHILLPTRDEPQDPKLAKLFGAEPTIDPEIKN